MNSEWIIQEPGAEELQLIKQLARELSISELSARLLVNRGIRTADEARSHIRPSLENLYDPFLMQDMERAVRRLRTAIDHHERVMIYGDYDVDGTTAVAMMYTFLHRLTDNLIFYIPDRYSEGYGISTKGVDTAKAEGCTLIIALDCGIKATDKVAYATELGIDFIICDHHTPGEQLPQAKAVLNMKREDCAYPFKDLSGCGVGFKLIQAYSERYCLDMQYVYQLLPLLAMSIASDIVSVTDENRILAHFGLRGLNRQPSVGIQAIMRIAGIDPYHVTINDLGYKIGPRINAAGRMRSGAEAVKLLITTDPTYAGQLADEIKHLNTERQGQDMRTTEEAIRLLQSDPDNERKHVTVVYAPDWHKGVLGIAASRLTETYYRPTIVLSGGEDGIISGSARSVSDFDIYNAIDSCRDLLTHFGGHKYAAGLSLRLEDLEEFKARLEAYVAAHVTPEQQHPIVQVEAEIALEEITPQFVQVMKCLEPFGPGNPRPVFLTRNLINNSGTRAVGREGQHLRLDVTDRTAAITGIAYWQADKALHLQNGRSADICYELEENTFNHKTIVQMKPVEIRLK